MRCFAAGLYGHVAAMAYLAQHVEKAQQVNLAREAMRLLHWNLCLDYLESSSWAIRTTPVDVGLGGLHRS